MLGYYDQAVSSLENKLFYYQNVVKKISITDPAPTMNAQRRIVLTAPVKSSKKKGKKKKGGKKKAKEVEVEVEEETDPAVLACYE